MLEPFVPLDRLGVGQMHLKARRLETVDQPIANSQYQLKVDSTTTQAISSRQGSSNSRIFVRSLGKRFSAITQSSSSVTVTTLLFECRSIPLYFVFGLLWLGKFANSL